MTPRSLRRLVTGLTGLLIGNIPLARAAEVEKHYHFDAVGTVRAITDKNGNVLERFDYHPFGEDVSAPTTTNSRRFAGKERDPETAIVGGFDYFGARYYFGRIARFTTVDPYLDQSTALVDPQRWNRYAYGRNNPFRFVDPNGKDIFDVGGGIITAFGSNLVLGANRPEPYNRDFRIGQAIGDAASIIAGGYEFEFGAGAVVLGLAGLETGPVGLAVAGVGAATAVHGLGVSASGLIHLSKIADDSGTIYTVPGSGTSSGKPYIGRHNKPEPAKTRRSKDGRDRSKAEVVDTYDANDTHAGRVKEQEHIDSHGLENLDNKRNEIRKP